MIDKAEHQLPIEKMKEIVTFFHLAGYRGPSMLDIANHLRVAKKTLYTYVSNKEELIIKTIDYQGKFMAQKAAQINDSENHLEDSLFAYFALITQFYQTFTRLCVSDLEQYYPIANIHFQQHESQLNNQLSLHYQNLIKQQKIVAVFSAEYLTETTIFHVKQLVYGQLSVAEKSINELVKTYFDYQLMAVKK